MTLGDNDYTRGRSFRANWVSSFGWLGSAGVDVAGTLGNHDVEFGRGRYEFALLRMPGPYYVRRVNEVELIVLDSTAITAAQTRWLERTLARRSGFRRIVAFHHPPYTCGGHLGSATVRKAWVPLFERYGVRLVLNGHDHNYQRFERNGVTYVVHGGGGAESLQAAGLPSHLSAADRCPGRVGLPPPRRRARGSPGPGAEPCRHGDRPLPCDVMGRPRRRSDVNRPTFSAVAEDCLDEVYRYLLMLTSNPSLADDLTGATFEKAFKQWRRYDPRRAAPVTWLCSIARTTALDHFRADARRRRREERFALEQPEAEELSLAGLSPELEAAMVELTAAEREVVALRIVLDFDAESAARVLGVSRTACSMRLARALTKLEERMAADALA